VTAGGAACAHASRRGRAAAPLRRTQQSKVTRIYTAAGAARSAWSSPAADLLPLRRTPLRTHRVTPRVRAPHEIARAARAAGAAALLT
jgi:hypothetical protein